MHLWKRDTALLVVVVDTNLDLIGAVLKVKFGSYCLLRAYVE